MKKILLFMAALMMAVCIVSCGSNEKKPQTPPKSPKEIYMDTLKAFKSKAIDGLSRYLKEQISSDPSVGEVIKTKDYILNDSIYFAKAKILIQNKFGAKEQYDDLWFSVCKMNSKLYLFYWSNEERCQKGLDYIIGENKVYLWLENFAFTPEMYSPIYKIVCAPQNGIEKLINDF